MFSAFNFKHSFTVVALVFLSVPSHASHEEEFWGDLTISCGFSLAGLSKRNQEARAQKRKAAAETLKAIMAAAEDELPTAEGIQKVATQLSETIGA